MYVLLSSEPSHVCPLSSSKRYIICGVAYRAGHQRCCLPCMNIADRGAVCAALIHSLGSITIDCAIHSSNFVARQGETARLILCPLRVSQSARLALVCLFANEQICALYGCALTTALLLFFLAVTLPQALRILSADQICSDEQTRCSQPLSH